MFPRVVSVLVVVALGALAGCAGAAGDAGVAERSPGGPQPSIAGADGSSSVTSTTVVSFGTKAPRIVRGAVAIVGDSLTAQSTNALRAGLAEEGWKPVTIDAERNRRIVVGSGPGEPKAGRSVVKALKASGTDPHTWIVALGTNDVLAAADDTQVRALVMAMLDAIGPGHRIVWVDVYLGQQQAATTRWNRMLREIASERTDLVLAPWSAVAYTEGILIDDQIHPTVDGQAAFAITAVNGAEQAAARP